MKYPVLISIPHSSSFINAPIQRRMALTEKQIRSYSDLYTDEIYDFSNFHVVKGRASRLVVDLNRAPDDIITICQLAHEGVIVQITEDGKEIYKEGMTPSEEDIAERIISYHDSYHEKIEQLAKKCVFLIDGHSYKSIGPKTKDDSGKERADICLGNRHYTTCTQKQTNFFKEAFEKLGYSVSINDPYDGRYILSYHCHRKRFPGIQIELKRSLYMNEQTLHPRKKDIQRIKNELETMIAQFIEEFFPNEKSSYSS